VDLLVLREVLGPTAVGFLVYTFLLMIRAIFGLLEEVLVRGLSPADALRLLQVTVPHVVVLTLPMSFLFGVLIGVGRLHGDNEIVALQAGGLSLRAVARPILAMALVLVAFNTWLTTSVMPAANQELRVLKTRLFKSANLMGRIEPKVFYEDLPGLLLYVRDMDENTGIWRGVLIFQKAGSGRDAQLIVAERGRMVERGGSGIDDGGAANGAVPWLMLHNVTHYEFDPQTPSKLRVHSSESELIRPSRKNRGTITINPGMRERSTWELFEVTRSRAGGKASDAKAGPRPDTKDIFYAAVELQKRFAIPAASLVFGLIALPLGIGSRASRRGRAFLLSMGVIVVYYVILNNGEFLARQGEVPAFAGVWAANLLIAAAGLVQLWRKGRWLGERHEGGGVFARMFEALTRRWKKRRARRSGRGPVTGSIPVALQGQASVVRFPTLLDRYLTVRFLGPLAFVLASVSVLYIVVDLADKIDEMAKHTASAWIFFQYYWNIVPQIVLDVTPMGMLIAVLLLLSILEKNLELTALKAGGISLYRVIVPILLLTVAVCAGVGLFQESIVPRSNRNAQHLLDIIKGRTAPRTVTAGDRQWIFSRDGSTLFNYLRFDRKSQTLIRFSMYRFDDRGRLCFQLFTKDAHFVDGAWEVSSGWFRQIHPNGRDEFHRVGSKMALQVSETPDYFASERHSPSEMSYAELRRHIRDLAASGYHSARLEVRLYQKFTNPLSVLVMILLGLPFGINRTGGRRSSAMQGVAIGLGLGIAYYLLVALFGKMGEASILPPLVGAWAPAVLAGLFGINRLTTLKT